MAVFVGLGQVEYVENNSDFALSDSADGMRIKVRMDSDGIDTPVSKLPYAVPLLPTLIQTAPQVGEGVFVISSDGSDFKSGQRYYIGPIISQPQFNEKCEFEYGRGPAVSLLNGRKPSMTNEYPLTAYSRAGDDVKGSFPSYKDVALLGRGQEDIVLKYRGNDNVKESDDNTLSEVDIRAGIRLKPTDAGVKFLKGNVIFNSKDPAYIQVKYRPTGLAGLRSTIYDDGADNYESPEKREGNGIVNVVADKINLISHKDSFGSAIADKDELTKEEEIDNIMAQLHRSVYGDELVHLLKLIVDALFHHQHPLAMFPPTVEGTSLAKLGDYDYEKILSPNVRIS